MILAISEDGWTMHAEARVDSYTMPDGYHHALPRRHDTETDDGIATDDFDDVDEPREDTPDEMAERAWGSTLLAFVLLPGVMHLYAIALLLSVPLRELSPKGRKHYTIAWVLNLAVLAVAVWLVVRAVG